MTATVRAIPFEDVPAKALLVLAVIFAVLLATFWLIHRWLRRRRGR